MYFNKYLKYKKKYFKLKSKLGGMPTKNSDELVQKLFLLNKSFQNKALIQSPSKNINDLIMQYAFGYKTIVNQVNDSLSKIYNKKEMEFRKVNVTHVAFAINALDKIKIDGYVDVSLYQDGSYDQHFLSCVENVIKIYGEGKFKTSRFSISQMDVCRGSFETDAYDDFTPNELAGYDVTHDVKYKQVVYSGVVLHIGNEPFLDKSNKNKTLSLVTYSEYIKNMKKGNKCYTFRFKNPEHSGVKYGKENNTVTWGHTFYTMDYTSDEIDDFKTEYKDFPTKDNCTLSDKIIGEKEKNEIFGPIKFLK